MDKGSWEQAMVRLTGWNWMVLAGVVAAGLGIGGFFGREIPPEVPLWYSRPWGGEQLAKPVWLILPILLSAGVGLGIQLIAWRLKSEPVLATIILAGGIVGQLILGLGLLRIVLLVT
ncbi:MAG: hypothetical protein UX91_C0001G0079 [Candidatus Amesbacteria bacterium GW2011_GWB1_47_19]|nr:MAG: hypothetical protein UW51_C0001G0079 [Candidatus Amesbacteria bacterium GW2011_GWA1_44_24]KKU32091.1 MAG: hypothetical protein UX46_C0001G0078 [Candidatus Amesbacteria bacterium GW2011_GWC1_46_24]KKU67775.1 MAG: hypothetical protein UX91_C0001G0079 [Candidatus Amesbacteria bacterium GW2011_GWB1_47_19]OGD06038.1 MAG: hypothetical protein A2379_03020 [Candidatus Amesbacteria bacterium RIFOXYB1_FULL_47_13]HBC72372.1 hypothetical protein [Candidatus Amesbacteria bacterium]